VGETGQAGDVGVDRADPADGVVRAVMLKHNLLTAPDYNSLIPTWQLSLPLSLPPLSLPTPKEDDRAVLGKDKS